MSVGTSLSGGLDSSSIVCNMAKWQGHGSISSHTFSARFEGFKKDEGNYIEKVIEKTGVIPHATWPTGDEMYRDFEKLCWHQEDSLSRADKSQGSNGRKCGRSACACFDALATS